METYGFLPIAASALIVYLISYFFTRTPKFKFTTHRRVWNLLLLISFMVTGMLGMFMAFVISFGLDISYPYTILKIHVGFGIVWFIIATFHFLWHLSYFRKSIKILFTNSSK
ncbi:MAG: hypothetical protein R6V16_05355 [Bacteroidales bacterium]